MMEVNSFPSAAKYIDDTFIYPKDISGCTYGHVLKIYLAENKKASATAKTLHTICADLKYGIVYSGVQKIQRGYNKILSKIHNPNAGKTLATFCETRILDDTPQPTVQQFTTTEHDTPQLTTPPTDILQPASPDRIALPSAQDDLMPNTRTKCSVCR